MDTFETLLAPHQGAVERYVKFKIPILADAEDVLQDVYLTAFRKLEQLQSPEQFKPWLLSIARSKCADFFRAKARRLEIPLEEAPGAALSYGCRGRAVTGMVEDTLSRIPDKDRQILYLYFWKEYPQAEIARLLNIPLGTVKSRLHTAKAHFKEHYPHPKGEPMMKKLPELLPDYTITPASLPPFPVRWREVMGWFIVPQVGEKVAWAEYDLPSRKRSDYVEMEAVGKALIHGIEGVEVHSNTNDQGGFHFVVQQTEDHCRYLAESHMENGVHQFTTFLDGDSFLTDWGFGPDNCGHEINLSAKGRIRLAGNGLTCAQAGDVVDLVQRCTVTILGTSYDTVRLFYLDGQNQVASEQYLDKQGRTILWRRFNHNNWAQERYQKPWTELLPDNDRLTINGETYVHWYDCITDYIL